MKKPIATITASILGAILLFYLISTFLDSEHSGQTIINALSDPIKPSYDVIVFGGEPEGVAAAVAAARNGATTLLIDERAQLGGLFTYGKMNILDFPFNEGLDEGIFGEWHKKVGGKDIFDPEEGAQAFLELARAEKNLSLLFDASLVEVIRENSLIKQIKVNHKGEEVVIEAARFIDGTDDADLAAMADVPYFIGNGDINPNDQQMAASLMVHLKGVNWKGIKETADKETFGSAVVKNDVAWGFGELLRQYKPTFEDTRLRGLNLGRVGDEYYINALQIFFVDGVNEQSKQQAIEKAKIEIDHIVAFLNEKFLGFENSVVASYPSELYIRESRHIRALYQLPLSDIWENKFHEDTIAYGGYPVDIQARILSEFGTSFVNPKRYGIPFRSLVPINTDNLLVVSRSAGYSSLAAGSVRVVPTLMATGQAAGAASVFTMDERMTFTELANDAGKMQEFREALMKMNVTIDEFEFDYPYSDADYYPYMRHLINAGALPGGYGNDIGETRTISNHTLVNLLNPIFFTYYQDDTSIQANVDYLNTYRQVNAKADLTKQQIITIIEGLPHKDFMLSGNVKFADHYSQVIEHIEDQEVFTLEDAIIILGELLNWE